MEECSGRQERPLHLSYPTHSGFFLLLLDFRLLKMRLISIFMDYIQICLGEIKFIFAHL